MRTRPSRKYAAPRLRMAVRKLGASAAARDMRRAILFAGAGAFQPHGGAARRPLTPRTVRGSRDLLRYTARDGLFFCDKRHRAMKKTHVWAATAAGILLALAAPQFALAQSALRAQNAQNAQNPQSAAAAVGKI